MRDQESEISRAMKQLWAMLATAYPHSFISALGQYGGNASKLWEMELAIYGADAIALTARKSIRMRDPKTGEAMQFPPTLPVIIELAEHSWAELNNLPNQENAFHQVNKLLKHKVDRWPSDFLFNLYLRINEKHSTYNWLRLPADKQQRAFPAIYSLLVTDWISARNIKQQPDGLIGHANENTLRTEQISPTKEKPALLNKPDFAALRDKLVMNKS